MVRKIEEGLTTMDIETNVTKDIYVIKLLSGDIIGSAEHCKLPVLFFEFKNVFYLKNAQVLKLIFFSTN